MFVKPHDAPPLLCFNAQTEMRFRLKQLLFPEDRRYWPFVQEFIGHRWIPRTKPVTRSFYVFFNLHLNKRLSKQWWGWWFETQSHPLWRHCNEVSGANRIPYRERVGLLQLWIYTPQSRLHEGLRCHVFPMPGIRGRNFISASYGLSLWALHVKVLSGECHRIPHVMMSQHWFR